MESSEMGRLGGKKTLKLHGKDHFRKIGKKGAKIKKSLITNHHTHATTNSKSGKVAE